MEKSKYVHQVLELYKSTNMYSKITIPNQCPKKWTELSGESSKRFCGACSKQVHDFTKMDTEEIIQFLKGRNGSVCGVFFKKQLLQMSFNEKVKYSVRKHKRTPLKLSVVLMAIVFSTMLNFFSSCVQKTMGEIVPVTSEITVSKTPQVQPIDTIPKLDSTQENSIYMMGEIEFVPENTIPLDTTRIQHEEQVMGKLHAPTSYFKED